MLGAREGGSRRHRQVQRTHRREAVGRRAAEADDDAARPCHDVHVAVHEFGGPGRWCCPCDRVPVCTADRHASRPVHLVRIARGNGARHVPTLGVEWDRTATMRSSGASDRSQAD